MPKAKTRSRLSHATALGIKELPSNTAWLIGKAWRPAAEEIPEKMNHLGARVSDVAQSAAESAGPSMIGARRKFGVAGKLLAEAVPGVGQESVSDLIEKADSAAEHAREVEATAVRLAQQAKDEADAAARTAAESDHAMEQARTEAQEMVDTRVESAQHEADSELADLARQQEEKLRHAEETSAQRVSQLRHAEETTALKALKKIEAQANSRVDQAEKRAEQSQEIAAKAIETANEALVKAQQLADEAAQAAQEAAVEATREVERLAQQAKERTAEAKRRSSEADRVRDRAGKSAARVRSNGHTQLAAKTMLSLTADDLQVLAKQDLLRVAQGFEVEGRASMSKPELLNALESEGVSPTDLTKRELLDVGESWGLDVRAAMSKSELVALVDSQIDQ